MKRILALEPFGGGSHADFIDGWAKHSRHELTILQLPAVHWKWRSRHSALTLAEQANRLVVEGRRYDIVFCSDMLSLAEWQGFACQQLSVLPTVAYFHENQFSYPLAVGESRDYHFAYNNILTAIRCRQLWFNSEFHRREFSQCALGWLRRMPDFRHIDLLEAALKGSQVCPPGIRINGDPERRSESGILTIGWVARWEHDKRPDILVSAIETLIDQGLPFRLVLLGADFGERNPSYCDLLELAGERVLHAGFVESRAEYFSWLQAIDIVVSTAAHEFFGIAILEAVAAGAYPLVPERLAYPEVFELATNPHRQRYFYPDDGLAERLRALILDPSTIEQQRLDIGQLASRYEWSAIAARMDRLIEGVAEAELAG